MRILIKLICFLSIAILCACSSESGPAENNSRYPEAEAQNIDPEGLENAYHLASTIAASRWLIVERNGVIVMEEYFNGSTADSYTNIWSDTKSITSILMGIAIDQGYIESIDQPISDYIADIQPDLDPVKGAIPIRHFLTMTSGLRWYELSQDGIINSNDFPTWINSDNQVEWVFDRPLLYTPGEHWNYHTGGSHLLAVIIARAIGGSLYDFAMENLFNPLDIEVGTWPQDKQGYFYGSHGINLKGRDMLKIGRMMLDSGMYNGVQVLSSSWVNESTSYIYPIFNIEGNPDGYGYQWWVGSFNGMNYFYANGYGGQLIIVFPEEDLIIVSGTNAELYNLSGANQSGEIMGRAIWQHIMPAVH